MGLNDHVYLDAPEQWDALARLLRKSGVCGLDTEFYGLDVRKESCVGRARVHVWSVAVRSASRSPLGFLRARGWVLPASALEFPALVAVLEDPSIRKAVHNQPVDDHALHNHGVDLKGCINTLDLARWVWPELISQGGFGLKNLMSVKLMRDPIAEFKDVVGYDYREEYTVEQLKSVTVCSCGEPGCRKRKGHEKSKELELHPVVRERRVKGEHPLESIVPGHERWDLLVDYAAEDAVAALEILELAERQKNPAPYPYAKVKRPGYNQAVSDAIVVMERVGFFRDREFCATQAEKAEGDEAKGLAWLRKWFRKNLTGNDTLEHEWSAYADEDIDGIWSSPKQLGELFDFFEFPRSPVWKKGKVKPGEMKLDAIALLWVAKNYAPAKQLVDHVLHLKRIRSGKKYLLKLRDAPDIIHPIAGPAGDADDRNGAVTGRLGIKGVLEAQQLPTREDVDLYQVRRAIVA